MATETDFSFPVTKVEVSSQPIEEVSAQDAGKAMKKTNSDAGILEAWASYDHEVARVGSGHQFIEVCQAAWSTHRPLILKPDHFWIMIVQGVAVHVEANAEELRSKFVNFQDKMELHVEANDFVKGGANNDWSRMFESFTQQIRDNTVDGVLDDLTSEFTTTTNVEKMCANIAVMDVCKQFFAYTMHTCCGFPSITLKGSVEDWEKVRSRAENLLTSRCLPDFASEWGAALYPVMDRIVSARQGGKVDVDFWNSMIKRGAVGGSGGYSYFTGWLNAFIPYLSNKQRNSYCVDYSNSEAYQTSAQAQWMGGAGGCGPDIADFPAGLVSAPVLWDYLGTDYNMDFRAGFIGAKQDKATMALEPLIGWSVFELP